jgi:hypothetical protein
LPIFRRKFFKRKRPLYKKKASFKRKTGWNKTYKKKRYLKKTIGKAKYKKRISSVLGRSTRLKLKTMAKALETKYIEKIGTETPKIATPQAVIPPNWSVRNSWGWESIIPFNETSGLFSITMGTQKNQRIGTRITLKQLRLKGTLMLSAFDSGHLEGGLRLNEAWEMGKASLTCVILICKNDTDHTTPLLAELFPGIQTGHSSGVQGPIHYTNTIADYTRPYGIENRPDTPRLRDFKVVYKKTFHPIKTRNTDLLEKASALDAIQLSTITRRRANFVTIPVDVNFKKMITMEWKNNLDTVPQKNNMYIYWIPSHNIVQEKESDNGVTLTTKWSQLLCKWVDC